MKRYRLASPEAMRLDVPDEPDPALIDPPPRKHIDIDKMNNERRKTITQLLGKLEDIQSEIESLQSEEQDAYDNMPESFQNGERGSEVQSAIDALESAASSIDDVISSLEEASN